MRPASAFAAPLPPPSSIVKEKEAGRQAGQLGLAGMTSEGGVAAARRAARKCKQSSKQLGRRQSMAARQAGILRLQHTVFRWSEVTIVHRFYARIERRERKKSGTHGSLSLSLACFNRRLTLTCCLLTAGRGGLALNLPAFLCYGLLAGFATRKRQNTPVPAANHQSGEANAWLNSARAP